MLSVSCSALISICYILYACTVNDYPILDLLASVLLGFPYAILWFAVLRHFNAIMIAVIMCTYLRLELGSQEPSDLCTLTYLACHQMCTE